MAGMRQLLGQVPAAAGDKVWTQAASDPCFLWGQKRSDYSYPTAVFPIFSWRPSAVTWVHGATFPEHCPIIAPPVWGLDSQCLTQSVLWLPWNWALVVLEIRDNGWAPLGSIDIQQALWVELVQNPHIGTFSACATSLLFLHLAKPWCCWLHCKEEIPSPLVQGSFKSELELYTEISVLPFDWL